MPTRLLAAGSLVLLTACVVVAHPRPPPPRLLTAQEAVNEATYFARSRGLVIEHTYDARLDRHARWHVDLGGAGGRDRAQVTVDGYSGHVLSARLRGPGGQSLGEPPPPGAVPAPAPAPSAPPPSVPPGSPPGEIPPAPSGIPPPPPSS